MDKLKSSLSEIEEILAQTGSRCQNLISSTDKFFFSIFEKIIPEFKESLFNELRKNIEILQNQKSRVQNLLMILEKEYLKSQEAMQVNSAQEIITMKTNLLILFLKLVELFLFSDE
jgi:hypothetical protein